MAAALGVPLACVDVGGVALGQLLDLDPPAVVAEYGADARAAVELRAEAARWANSGAAGEAKAAWRELAAVLHESAAARAKAVGVAASFGEDTGDLHALLGRTMAAGRAGVDELIDEMAGEQGLRVALAARSLREAGAAVRGEASGGGVSGAGLERAVRAGVSPLARAVLVAPVVSEEQSGLIERLVGLAGAEGVAAGEAMRASLGDASSWRAAGGLLVALGEVEWLVREPPGWLAREAVPGVRAGLVSVLGGLSTREAVRVGMASRAVVPLARSVGIARRLDALEARGGDRGSVEAARAMAVELLGHASGLAVEAGAGGVGGEAEVEWRARRLERGLVALGLIVEPLAPRVETEAGEAALGEARTVLLHFLRIAWKGVSAELATAERRALATLPRAMAEVGEGGGRADPLSDPGLLTAVAAHRDRRRALEGVARASRWLEGAGFDDPLPALPARGGGRRVSEGNARLAQTVLALSEGLREEETSGAAMSVLTGFTEDVGRLNERALMRTGDAALAAERERALSAWVGAWTAERPDAVEAVSLAARVGPVSERIEALAELAGWREVAERVEALDAVRLNGHRAWEVEAGVVKRLTAGLSREVTAAVEAVSRGDVEGTRRGLARLERSGAFARLVVRVDELVEREAAGGGRGGVGGGVGGGGGEAAGRLAELVGGPGQLALQGGEIGQVLEELSAVCRAATEWGGVRGAEAAVWAERVELASSRALVRLR